METRIHLMRIIVNEKSKLQKNTRIPLYKGLKHTKQSIIHMVKLQSKAKE